MSVTVGGRNGELMPLDEDCACEDASAIDLNWGSAECEAEEAAEGAPSKRRRPVIPLPASTESTFLAARRPSASTSVAASQVAPSQSVGEKRELTSFPLR